MASSDNQPLPDRDAGSSAGAGHKPPHDAGSADNSRRRRQPHVLVGLALWVLVVFLVFYFFAATKFVLLVALATAVLAAALQPVADRLPGPRGVRAVCALLLLLLAVGGAIALLSWGLYGPLQESVKEFPETRAQADEVLSQWASRLGLEVKIALDDLGAIAGRLFTGGAALGLVADVASALLTTTVAILVVLVGTMYLLTRPPGSLSGAAIELLPPGQQPPARQSIQDLQSIYRWWFIGILFSMVVVGVLFGVGFWIIGLRFALALALLAALLESVPTLGPLATLLVSLLVAATQGRYQLLGVVIVYLVVQAVESYVVAPLVMRRAVHIPPVVTLLTLIFWGNVFGVAGLLLTIPIDMTIWKLLENYLVKDRQE